MRDGTVGFLPDFYPRKASPSVLRGALFSVLISLSSASLSPMTAPLSLAGSMQNFIMLQSRQRTIPSLCQQARHTLELIRSACPSFLESGVAGMAYDIV